MRYHTELVKLTGIACKAPYLDCSVSSNGNETTGQFKLRIDTGADITCVPRKYVDELEGLALGDPVTVRAHDGTITRVWTSRVTLHIPDLGMVVRPERGVLVTYGSTGLLGMDIITMFDEVIVSANGVTIVTKEDT